MKIGVFDSGVGGLAVVNAIQKALPELEVIYREDKENVPYGNKEPAVLRKLVIPILQGMIEQGCEVIVIACNTITTTLITELRQTLPLPLIGMEPMVKPAAAISQSGVIAICATPATLSSERYKWLKETYAKELKVLEPDCSGWSYMIENKQIDRQKVHALIDTACAQGADVIVLGCTHYHWIENLIKETADGRATVLQPEVPVITQLKRVLKQLS